MHNLGKVSFALGVACIVGTLLLLGANAGCDQAGQPGAPVNLAASESGDNQVATQDSPAKEVPAKEAGKSKPDPKEKGKDKEKNLVRPESHKEISLVEAIGIAEKRLKGKAVKAERKDKPETMFKGEVIGWDGNKAKVELTADGKVREKRPDEHPEKKDGKKKDDKKKEKDD